MQEARLLQGLAVLIITCSVRVCLARNLGNSFNPDVLRSMITGPCEPVPLQTQLSCFTRKYRTFNGTCNNLCNVTQGSVLRPFRRLLPPAYQDGERAPRSLGSNGNPLPNARKVSKIVFVSSKINEGHTKPNFTHVTMIWGQFLDHDIILTRSNESAKCGNNSLPCRGPDEGCIGIDILPGNELRTNRTAVCMPLRRSAIKNGEQMNSVSSFIDGSQIYGTDYKEAEHLRDRTASIGLLRVVPFPGRSTKSPILPRADPEVFCRSSKPSMKPCFHAGDYRRVNENPALMAMHTVWVREHNRIANYLHILNPAWQDERLFQEARKIVIAELQHITYNEWVPVFFNENLRKDARILLEPAGKFFDGYDPSVNPEIMNCFATAAMRMGHSMIRDDFGQFDGQFRQQGFIPIKGAFFDPTALFSSSGDGISEILLGLVSQTSQKVDRFFSPAVRESLLINGPTIYGTVGDLSAINIQRGRDHGLPPYNQFRKVSGQGLAASIDMLTNINSAQREILRVAYNGGVGDIDLYAGGMSENPVPGSLLGKTFTYILTEGLRNLRAGDRFWYERNDSYIGFSMRQLNAIRNVSLARVLCDNSEEINKIYPNVFREKSTVNSLTDCASLEVVDLNEWKEDV